MASSDRKPYETATVLDQAFLDDCFDNLNNALRLTVDVQAAVNATYSNPAANLVLVTSPAHGYVGGDTVHVLSADYFANGFATVVSATTDTFTYDAGAPVSPSTGAVQFLGFLRFSDQNIYVGSKFYEARLVFPVISRTIGELLAPSLEFSTLQIEINNADERFNHLMPAGDDYGAWIGARVIVKLGLRDVEATYTEIFTGTVSSEGGFQRTLKSFILLARNDFERLNDAEFPTTLLSKTGYPDLEDDKVNVTLPVVYGDWTLNVEPDMASVPAFLVNGANINVTGEGSPHSTNAQYVISENDLLLFDATQVYVKRSSVVQVFDPADVVNVGAGNKSFELRQSGTIPAGVTIIDGVPFVLERGDEIFVKVKGKDLGAYSDNIVSIARDVLETYAAVDAGEFHTSWDTYRDKASPVQSAIATFKARAWVQEAVKSLDFVLSLFEQVRLEAFVDRNRQLKISSLHFEDFEAAPSFKVKNWDIEDNTFKPSLDQRNNFNRVQAVFNFLPNRNENFQKTKVLRNDAAADAIGREISKKIVLPNLYDETVATAQATEILRLTSSYLENVDFVLTWRALRLDIGDFVNLSVEIESTQFQDVPFLIRKIGYDPDGIKLPVGGYSMQMVRFPGWTPSYSGITGGYDAVITEET